MKQKIGISCCYGIAFILYSAIMFFLEAASVPTFWIGSFCSLLMLALCLLVVWKGDFFGGIPHLHYTLGLAVSGFFCLQLLLGGLAAVLPLQGGSDRGDHSLWHLRIDRTPRPAGQQTDHRPAAGTL